MLTKCTQTAPDADSTTDVPETHKQHLPHLSRNVHRSFSVSFTHFMNNSARRRHQRYFPTPYFPKCDKNRYRWSPTAMLSHFPRLRTGHRDVIILISLVLFPTVTVMRQGIWRHFTGDVGSLETGFIPSCHTQQCQVTKDHSGHQFQCQSYWHIWECIWMRKQTIW